MKTLELNQMENLTASSSGRSCMIAGALAGGLAIFGIISIPARIGSITLIGAAALSGCFN